MPQLTVRTCEQVKQRIGEKTMAKPKTNETKVAKKAMAEMGVFTAEQIQMYEDCTAEIGRTIRTANHAQIKTGGLFAIIFDNELYKVRGFNSLLEYAQNEFMYDGSKGQLSDMMLTFKAFGDTATLEVKEEYANYTFSQLKLMRKLKPEDLEKVTLTTTTRELAEILKGYKALPQKEESTTEESTTEETTETENVSRETSHVTKEETTGNVEPYTVMTFGIGEFEEFEAESIKQMILECFKAGNDVLLKYKFD